jgi:hypothetical protein
LSALPFICGAIGLPLCHTLRQGDPHGSLHMHPRPYNMSATGVKKGTNQHNQAKTSPRRLTQGLVTPSLKRTRPQLDRRFTPRARILQTQVSISVSSNSAEKGQPWQLSPRYLHIVTSHRRSAAADESAEEVRTHEPISEQILEDVTHGLQLAGTFLRHPVLLARPNGGALTITTGSGAPTSFLRKNHSFHHQTNGLETERRKYG